MEKVKVTEDLLCGAGMRDRRSRRRKQLTEKGYGSPDKDDSHSSSGDRNVKTTGKCGRRLRRRRRNPI